MAVTDNERKALIIIEVARLHCYGECADMGAFLELSDTEIAEAVEDLGNPVFFGRVCELAGLWSGDETDDEFRARVLGTDWMDLKADYAD